MNESKNPNLKWFEFSCGTFKVGTWATSRRAAKAVLKPHYHIEDKSQRKYGKAASVTIVV